MSTITRSWLAFAAIGAGLIHIALVMGSPLPLGAALAVLGFAEFGWGVATFARDVVLLPRVMLAICLTPVLGWGLLLAISTLAEMPALAASVPFLPLAVASVFGLFIAGTLAVYLRRRADVGRADTEGSPRVPSVGRYLLALVVGGLVVAGMTTPALAATVAGATAQLHAEGEPYEFILPTHEGH